MKHLILKFLSSSVLLYLILSRGPIAELRNIWVSLLLSIVFGVIYAVYIRNPDKDEQSFSESEIPINAPLNELFQESVKVLTSIRGCVVCIEDRQKNLIKGITGITWHNMGEIITISLKESQLPNCYNVHLRSELRFKSFNDTMKKNDENIKKIENHLMSISDSKNHILL